MNIFQDGLSVERCQLFGHPSITVLCCSPPSPTVCTLKYDSIANSIVTVIIVIINVDHKNNNNSYYYYYYYFDFYRAKLC